MGTVGLLLAFAAVAALDLPQLIRRRQAKTLIVYSVIFMTALALSELQLLRVPMWNPNQGIVEAISWFVPQID